MYSGPSGLPSASVRPPPVALYAWFLANPESKRSAAVGSVMAQPPPGMLANPMDVDMADMSMADPDVKTFPDLPGAPYDPSSTGTSNTPLSISAMGNGNTMIGAGPMPTGFGMQNPSGTGSTLTEFTKRRNWSKLVLEELRDLMLVLSSDGRILHVSPSCKLLTSYDAFGMVGKLVSDFIHEDDKSMFVREFNESIASGHQMRFFYRLLRQDGSYQIFEAFGHPHHSSEAFSFGRGGAPYCRGYFMMSRPYPTKNAALLDSFLDHKIENERLLKRIADLKKEEQEEELEQESLWRSQEQGTETESLHGTDPIGGSDNGGTMMDTMPPPARPDVTGNPLTRQNLDEVLAAARPDSINDKMARYEGNSHIETIEMLTGLRYRDGER